MMKFANRGKFLDTNSLYLDDKKLNYAANPLLVKISDKLIRLYFNSRDFENRSSIYSIDLCVDKIALKLDSIKLQHVFGRPESYFSHGISVGNYFQLNQKMYVSVMGWKINPGEHWIGRIGKIEIDSQGDLLNLEDSAWFDIDSLDPISLSYPAIYQHNQTVSMWYGSTVTWDAGNGEMLHILKEKKSTDNFLFTSTNSVIPYQIGTAQAFSRPSIVEFRGRNLMAYSFRGAQDKYKIGFVWLDDFSTATQLGGLPAFLPSHNDWENEMVEYPSLFVHESKLLMLYNGNNYGKTGVGLTEIIV
jgi:hypothetical protein